MIDLNGYGLSLLLGVANTVKLSAGALAIGLCLGLAGAVAKLSASVFLRFIAEGLTTIIRGIPELLFILGLYLGSSVVVNSTAQFFGYQEYIDINDFWAGIIALSIVFGSAEKYGLTLCDRRPGSDAQCRLCCGVYAQAFCVLSCVATVLYLDQYDRNQDA